MRRGNRALALLLSACLLVSCAACGGGTFATTIRLVRTQGTVGIENELGRSVTPRTDLGLYSGYQVATQGSSYAWIDLDDAKLTKMDEHSQIEIQKEGKKLEIVVTSGGLFFNITRPLEDDEELNICTSTMMVGIRGTCGWVRTSDPDHMEVWLLEGTVECTAGTATATVSAGQMAAMAVDGSITVSAFTAGDVPAFVLEEVEDSGTLPGATGSLPDPAGSTPPGTPASEDVIAPPRRPVRVLHYNRLFLNAYTFGQWGVGVKETSTLDGSPIDREEYFYDGDGNCVRYNYFTGDGTGEYYEEYWYDPQGTLVRTDRYYADGDLRYYIEYTYNDNGTVREGIFYRPDGSPDGSTHDNLADDQPEMTLLNGYADISQIEDYKNHGDDDFYCEEELDAMGRLVRRSHYVNGYLTSYLVHTYDGQGDRVRTDYYNDLGELIYYLEYEYE